MPNIVICNTSPLFYFHRLRHIDLLQKLYQQITLPEAVVDELKAGQDQGEDVPNVEEFDWIKVRSVRVPELIKLITDLGAGEAQVLALAIEEPDSLIILDDRLAREVVKMRNLRKTKGSELRRDLAYVQLTYKPSSIHPKSSRYSSRFIRFFYLPTHPSPRTDSRTHPAELEQLCSNC